MVIPPSSTFWIWFLIVSNLPTYKDGEMKIKWSFPLLPLFGSGLLSGWSSKFFSHTSVPKIFLLQSCSLGFQCFCHSKRQCYHHPCCRTFQRTRSREWPGLDGPLETLQKNVNTLQIVWGGCRSTENIAQESKNILCPTILISLGPSMSFVFEC